MLAFTEFAKEELFWYAIVWHPGDVACPSRLGLTHGGDGAKQVGPLQDFRTGNFVLPTDVKVLKASEMEVTDQFSVSSVRCPGIGAIEGGGKGGEDHCPIDFQLRL